MPYSGAYMDGNATKVLTFPNKETADQWLLLQASIKRDAPLVFAHVHAAGGNYNDMTIQERAFGQNWLNQIQDLRTMSQQHHLQGLSDGLPPTIHQAEQDYIAIRQR